MAKITLACAAALILLGTSAYWQSDSGSTTALIPAVFGVILAVLGVAARRDAWRPHALHVAMGLAAVGAGASLWRGIPAAMDAPMLGLAVRTQLFMGALLLAYLAAGIQSFITARRPNQP